MTVRSAIVSLCLLVAACHSSAAPSPGAPTSEVGPPVAEREATKVELHGTVLEDPYAWLANAEDPRTRAYLEAENAYADAMLAPTEALQAELYDEILGHLVEDDASVPTADGPFVYYARTEKDRAYPILCRRPRERAEEPAAEQIIFDVNTMAEGHEYFDVGAASSDHAHRRFAVATDTVGDERYRLEVLDTQTGKWEADTIENTDGSSEWFADGQHFAYVVLDDLTRGYEIRVHRLGTPVAEDRVLLTEPDPAFSVSMDKTRSDRFIMATLVSHTTTEVHVIDTDAPEAAPKLFAPRKAGVEYYLEHQGDSLYVHTNEDALNFAIHRTPVDDWSRERWEPFVAHDPEVYLTGLEPFADHLVISQRRGGQAQLLVHRVADGERHVVDMPEPVYAVYFGANAEMGTTKLRFYYESMVTPGSVIDYDMNTREREVKKRTPVRGYHAGRYATERITATAADGTAIPISIVYRAPLEHDGTRPVLLEGYGAYGSVEEPSFSTARLALLDRGVVYAKAHVRGGGEMGRGWYQDGKLERKTNTFTDFIACAEHLVAKKITEPERLAIYGGSAGGLLVGAVLNMRPELFGAAIADVPFVDVVNTMLDESLPLTASEWEEWGDPRTKAGFDLLRSYSPYDNVTAQAYPPMLVLAGWSDPRVGYWEPAKWVARLRTKKADAAPLLLVTNMNAGHQGASGRYGWIREVARNWAFVLDQVAR